jgi:hypothetical protein
MSNAWTEETLQVGHKLKQLCRACGLQLTEESFSQLFAELGGVGANLDFDAFMRTMCIWGRPHDRVNEASLRMQKSIGEYSHRHHRPIEAPLPRCILTHIGF